MAAMISALLPAGLVALLAPLARRQSTQSDPPYAQRWQELGPAPITSGPYTGRVSAIACSPLDANRVFVAGADGGVWRTDDGGASWRALTDELPTTAIGALALDPADPDAVFAGTGEANFANHSRYGLGIYRSLDGGESWEHFGAATLGGRCVSALAVDPSDGDVVYAALTRAGGFPELAAAKGHPGATGDLGVFRSSDRGATWTRLGGGLPNLSATSLALDPSAPGRLYCGVGHVFGHAQNGVWRTLDGGATWTQLAGGLPASQAGRVTVALAPSSPARLYALITRPADATGGGASTLGAWRSSDGGNTWTALPVPSFQATYGWYLSVVSVRPSDPNTVFMGGLTLERSTSSGSSWSSVTPPHVDLHALAWDAAGRLWAGDDGGVHRSSDLGASWSALNAGLGLTQFYAGLSSHPSDERVFFGGLQDNGSVRRTTATSSWSAVFGGDGGWTQLSQTSPSTVFVEYQGTANLFRSTDGGTSFSFSGAGIDPGDRNCFLPPYLIDPSNASRMYYATHRLWRSTNGGSGWSALSSDLTGGSGAIRSLAISPADPGWIWAATSDGRVLLSTNGGSSFTLRLTGNPGWPRVTREIFPHPLDPASAWLAVSRFGTAQVRRTSDSGLSWTDLDGVGQRALPDLPVNTIAALPGPPDRLFAGTDRGLYHSPDGGASWFRFGRGLPNAPIIDLLVQPERNRIVVATQGRGAWTVRLEARARRP
jgi:photosystem II stability/assembly factor-like uncharacterized protein